jgi:hypothetical protein
MKKRVFFLDCGACLSGLTPVERPTSGLPNPRRREHTFANS